LTGDAGVLLAGGIDGAGKGFEQAFDDVMGFIAVKQFEVEVAAGFVGEALKEFAGEAEAEGAGQILIFFRIADFFLGKTVQSPPDEVRAAAEIDDATGEAFIHGDVGFAGKGVLGVKAMAVAAEAAFITQGLGKGLTEGDAAIFDGMVGIDGEIAAAGQLEVHGGMLGKEGEHVIEKGEAGVDL
jgi:hypothetical protein